MDGYYFQLSLFGVLDIVCIGRRFKERIVAEQLVVDVDYACRVNIYILGLVKIQKILNRDDAIKAKWINGTGAMGDIEMKGAEGGDKEGLISVQINPLTNAGLANRSSATISMDGIYGAMNNDRDVNWIASNNISSDDDITITVNPFHLLRTVGATDKCQAATSLRHQESLHLEQSVINNATEDASAADDNAALYIEYQNLQRNDDDTVYAMSADDSEVLMMSFEEWKTTRKQFKQGTHSLTHSLTH